MFSDRTRQRLLDIVQNADRLLDHAGDKTLDQFKGDLKTIDAVERCLERITEAVIQIGETDIERAQLGVAWAEIKGLGNRLRHEYRRIDARVIYDTVRDDILPLRAAAARALET